MSPKRPVEVRLAIAALAFLVAVVAVLGTWQVLAARSSQRSEIEAGEVSAAHLASSALASALASRLDLLSNLADNVSLSTIFTKAKAAEQATIASDTAPDLPRVRQLRRHLRQRPLGRQVAGRACSDWQRRVVAGLLRERDAQRQAVHLASDATKRPAQGAHHPPGGPGARHLGPDCRNTGGFHPRLEPCVANRRHNAPRRGALVVFDQFGHAFTGRGASAKQSFASLPGVSSALAGRTGAETGTVPGYSGQRLVGYAPVASTGWVVVVEEPSSVLAGPIDALTERLAAIGLAVAFLAAGIVALVASLLRKLIARASERRRIDGERRRGCSDDRYGRSRPVDEPRHGRPDRVA